MFAAISSATLVGVEPRQVRVEAHVGRATKETFSLVGLPDTAVREARDRVKAACASSGYSFPKRRVIVNLAPADLPKSGSAFDLPIALGVLVAAGLISREVGRVVALGELALDGKVQRARGALAAALVASRLGVPCLVPHDSAREAAIVEGADVRGVGTLGEAVRIVLGEERGQPVPPDEPVAHSSPDLEDVRGQALARRALEVAAAGGHHLLMVGPPGCGKTMLARRLPSILPDLSSDEMLESACVWSAADRHWPYTRRPPFRSPHHSASVAALLGGGSGVPVPGEVALAHRGVLFLDELGEFPINVLEGLRQPLEEGEVTVARKGYAVTYPAAAQVVAATNPCPCGFLGDRITACRCSEAAVERYRRRLSGPLLDRFDVRVTLTRPERLDGPKGEPSEVVRARVEAVRQVQRGRGRLNARLTPPELDRIRFEPSAKALLAKAVAAGVLSGRGYDRVRKVARTIADLVGHKDVHESDVAEAMSLRGGW